MLVQVLVLLLIIAEVRLVIGGFLLARLLPQVKLWPTLTKEFRHLLFPVDDDFEALWQLKVDITTRNRVMLKTCSAYIISRTSLNSLLTCVMWNKSDHCPIYIRCQRVCPLALQVAIVIFTWTKKSTKHIPLYSDALTRLKPKTNKTWIWEFSPWSVNVYGCCWWP
jgi:hypothetical protein